MLPSNSIEQIDDGLWVVSFLPDVFYACGLRSDTHLTIEKFRGDPTQLFSGQGHVCEIYATTFWALDPAKFLADVVDHFASLGNPDFPLELVYRFGGTITGAPVKIVPIKEVH